MYPVVMTATLSAKSWTVTTYKSSDLREIQGAIIEADWNLIGLGLMDLIWDDFTRELIAERGYEKIATDYRGYEVEVWKPIEVDE